jgi:hypothetical protein
MSQEHSSRTSGGRIDGQVNPTRSLLRLVRDMVYTR